ncbi:galactokinase [Janibacter sp. GXQ6167]|uniref:galactokinase n=1 Tax=Janibacter sp. GXQ6167 TaxID=3240791 RepID=UPI0035263DA4
MDTTGATERYLQMTGRSPEGVWSAPGRVNLIGEHTDYNGGLALPIALPQRTVVAAGRRDDGMLRVTSAGFRRVVKLALDDVGPGTPTGWTSYVAGVPWALRQAGYDVGGMDLAITSQVPLGAGLSSSAALECAVGAALADLYGLGLLDDDAGRTTLAAACVRAENEIAGASTGGLDQAASLRCRAGHALLLDCRDGSATPVPFDLTEQGLTLLVTDTRAPHSLVDGQYAARRRVCEEAAVILGVPTLREISLPDLDGALSRLPDDEHRRRVRHVVTETARVEEVVAALELDDWVRVGKAFVLSHASLRDDFEVTSAELDLAVDTALAHGALGARMTGGGFGGSTIALVPAERADDLASEIERAFADARMRAPVSFPVTASGPAARDA